MKKTIALFLSLSIAVFGLPVSSFAAKSLIRISDLSLSEARALYNLGNDVPRHGKDFLEMVVEPGQAKELAAKYKVTILIPDLDKETKRIMSLQKEGEKYFTYETMTQTLQNFSEKYKQICRLESIGKTFEGRDIWALKVSDNPEKDEKEPAVLIMGAHHAREWISFEVPMAALTKLLESYGKDETSTRLVNERETWFVPMVNPDGVVYSQTQSKYWRKNRSRSDNGSYGVDPNRNYGYHWGESGASTYPGSDTFMGPKAFSEKETQAIRDLAARENFAGDISYHSYSELILYPWSYASGVACEHHPIFKKMAEEMAGFNKYTPEESCDLYPSAGDTDDWLYSQNKSLSFTIELARSFIPAPSEIAGIVKDNLPCVFYMIDKAGTYGLVTPSGEDLIETLDLQDSINAIRDLSNLKNNRDYSDQITRLQKNLSQKILVEVTAGNTKSLEMLEAQKDCPALQSVAKIIRHCQAFERLHVTSQ